MPKDEYNVGYGEYTEEKLDQIEMVLEVHMRIVQGASRKPDRLWMSREYYYFDFAAGAGYSKGRRGSALIAVDTAARLGLSLNGYFCEMEPKTAMQLQGNLRDQPGNLRVLVGDCCETIPDEMAPLARVNGSRLGLILWDPNGAMSLPLPAIHAVIRTPCFERVDVLTYLAGATAKRWRGRQDVVRDIPRLAESLGAIGKRYLFVRKPVGNWQWTFVIATDWPKFPEFRKQGFRPVGSEEGTAIMETLNYTRAELKELHQPSLEYGSYEEYLRHPLPRRPRTGDGTRGRDLREVPSTEGDTGSPPTLPGLGDI